jgi:DNA-binding response OmpR family regulator
LKILLADDDHDLVEMISFVLQRDGYKVVTAFDGAAALKAFEAEAPDLVVLDLNMPKRSGLDVLRAIRASSLTPVVMLSVVADEDHIVDALDSGADDYLQKPFRPRELRARTRALLRRSRQPVPAQAARQMPITLGDIHLDPQRHEVTVDGRPARLTPTEFSLLAYLMRNHDMVLDASSIVASVWGYDADENEDVIRVTISRLRHKIEPDPTHPIYIINVPGVGYKFQHRVRSG